MRPDRVVAADAGFGGATEIERRGELVRMRAGRRVDDRMRPVDDLELLVAPSRALGALVRAVADLAGSFVSASAASAASKTSCVISQSPSCVLLKSLKG